MPMPAVGLLPDRRVRRLQWLSRALQQLLVTFPASDLLFSLPVESRFIAIACRHLGLLAHVNSLLPDYGFLLVPAA